MVWEKYSTTEKKNYIRFLQVYGALTNLFRQKHGNPIPYLDSKFQETVYAKVFHAKNIDIGNTPHDILSVFGSERIGIGLKTWMNSKPSFQKVMQLKRFKNDIEALNYVGNEEAVAQRIAKIKNERMRLDYERLGLKEDKNIYHYVTRDEGSFQINECAYPLVDLNNIRDIQRTDTSLQFSDGKKKYRYTFADSQIWQEFSSESKDTSLLEKIQIRMLEDPFAFLLRAYEEFFMEFSPAREETVEAYLPLYSYRTKEAEPKSGLNAWNAAPKSKLKPILRPLNEIYIPIPREFHKKNKDFFVKISLPLKQRKMPIEVRTLIVQS